MKRILFLAMSVLFIASRSVCAQTTEDNHNDRYYKAREILDKDGDYAEAAELLSENIRIYPKHVQSYMLLASIERRTESYGRALRLLDDALENNHKHSGISDATILWWKASIHDDMDESEKGLQIMTQAIKLAEKSKDPNLMDMLQLQAQLYYNLKQYDDSDNVYRRMIKLDETEQLPMIGLARNMNARERYDEALAILEDCKKYDSEYSEIYRFQMAAYEGKKDYRKMVDAMITLYETSENLDYLDVQKFLLEKKYSIAMIRQKIASEPSDGIWKLALASLYSEAHMYLDALKTFDDLISEYGTSSWILEERGDCYDELGLLDKAIEDYSMAIEEADDSDRARCHAVRAQALRSAGRYEEAIEDVQVFIDRYPAKAYGYYARGRCRELLGDREGAMKDYSEGIEIDEDYPYIYLMRGKMYLNNGDKDLAVKDFETVIGKDTIPDNGTCRHYALHFLGRDIEAEEWMEKLIAADPNSSVLWYDKACLLALIGKHDEAVKAFRTSMEKGYRHFVHIEMDSDIDSIRDREDFKTIVTQYQSALASEREIILETTSEETAQSLSEIAMRKMYGGTYEIPCSVNGLPLNMIFDTGASDVSISSVEASFMLKNGYLTEDDVRGSTRYMTASGEILEGTVLRLKEVQVGDAVLKNVDASVVHNQKAPILLGQSVLEKFGTITIDNVNSKLIIKQ